MVPSLGFTPQVEHEMTATLHAGKQRERRLTRGGFSIQTQPMLWHFPLPYLVYHLHTHYQFKGIGVLVQQLRTWLGYPSSLSHRLDRNPLRRISYFSCNLWFTFPITETRSAPKTEKNTVLHSTDTKPYVEYLPKIIGKQQEK